MRFLDRFKYERADDLPDSPLREEVELTGTSHRATNGHGDHGGQNGANDDNGGAGRRVSLESLGRWDGSGEHGLLDPRNAPPRRNWCQAFCCVFWLAAAAAILLAGATTSGGISTLAAWQNRLSPLTKTPTALPPPPPPMSSVADLAPAPQPAALAPEMVLQGGEPQRDPAAVLPPMPAPDAGLPAGAPVSEPEDVPFDAQPGDSNALCKYAGTTLPEDVVLSKLYTLKLQLRPEHFIVSSAAPSTFPGQLEWTVRVLQPTACLVLHSAGLNFSAIRVQGNTRFAARCFCGPTAGCRNEQCSPNVIYPAKSSAAAAQGLVIMDLGGLVLPSGETIVLTMAYEGTIGSGTGLHRSSPFRADTVNDGSVLAQDEVLLVTQMEPTFARSMLPCMDEPKFKAEFSLSLQVPSHLTALSNTAAYSVHPASDTSHTITFETTPVMSTYLLAVAVGRLLGRSRVVEAAEKGQKGINLTAWALPGKEAMLDVPLQAAYAGFQFYTQWTATEQPLAKFDFVAVPGKSGAMENWGLLLFDERRFLFNPETGGAYNRWLSADVVCHELAHQWYGNLATCADWDDITINEGLASFMEYKCVEAAFPEMAGSVLFQLAATPMGQKLGIHEGPHSLALAVDSDPLMPPLVFDLASPAHMASFSGEIIYSKGAAVVGMLEGYMDGVVPGSFQAAMQAYLEAYAYSNASALDYLTVLMATLLAQHKEAPGPVPPLCLPSCLIDGSAADAAQTLLDAWFTNASYPLVFAGRPGDSMQEVLQQHRFSAWGGPPTNQTWWIPLAVGTITAATPNDTAAAAGETPALPAPDAGSTPADATPGGAPASASEPEPTAAAAPAAVPTPAAPASQEPGKAVRWVELSAANVTLPALARFDDPTTNLTSWVVNRGGKGLFRAVYDAQHLAEMLGLLRQLSIVVVGGSGVIPSAELSRLVEASSFVDDVFAAALAGETAPHAALLVAAAVAAAPAASTGAGRYLLLLPALHGIQALGIRLRPNAACADDLDALTVKLLHPHVTDLAPGISSATDQQASLSQDGFLGNLAKGELVYAAAVAGDTTAADALCAAFAARALANATSSAVGSGIQPALVDGSAGLDPDWRGAVYMAAVAQPTGCTLQQSPAEVWAMFRRQWALEVDITEGERYLYSLPAAQTADLLNQTLVAAFNLEKKKSLAHPATASDAAQLLRLVVGSRSGSELAWGFVESNWAQLASGLSSALPTLPLLAMQQQLAQVQAFFGDSGAGAAVPEVLQQRLTQRLSAEVAWRDTWEAQLCAELNLP